MLSLFSRKSIKDKKQPHPQHHARTSSGTSQVSRTVMSDASRENYQYEQPTQEMGMTDLLKKHNSGERFLYAAVTSKDEEEEPSRLRRLIQFQPRLSRRELKTSEIPVIPLFHEVETFPLSSIIRKPGKGKEDAHPYVRITDATIVYGALISTDMAFSKVKVALVDNRLLSNKIAKSVIANTNVISKANMSLSYCFPRAESDRILLTVSREAAFLEQGMQWGAIQIQLQLEELEFPVQTSNTPVLAINHLPQGMLEDRSVNPDFIDVSVLNADRKRLADLYMDGDLADETAPVVNRLEAVKYAKSAIKGAKGKKVDKHVSPEWAFMNTRNAGITAGENSVEPSEEGSIEIPRSPSPPIRSDQLKSILRNGSSSNSPFSSPSDSPPRSQTVKFEDAEAGMSEAQPPEEPRTIVIEEPNLSEL